MTKLAVILLRGLIGSHHTVKHTLNLLKLTRKHAMVIVEDTPQNKGMLQKVKDYVTWGPISEETEKKLIDAKKEQKIYNLHPPRGGFERKGTKTPFTLGGALGNRKEAINELINKML